LDPTNHPLPPNSAIWIQQISSTPGLHAYDRSNGYTPIFGTDGSSDLWKWNGMMAHNTYAVAAVPGTWSATYDVYVGDALTGAAIPGYGSASTTLNWTSVPEPSSLALSGVGTMLMLMRGRRSMAKK
jgi:hypothetical protein